MNDYEVILNLWYVYDDQGIIYSLRAKAYVMKGTDESKLTFLQERSRFDYLIAEPFDVPSRFHIMVGSGRKAKKMPVGHVAHLQTLDNQLALFEDAIKVLENRFPAQSNLLVPDDPLVCITPLMQDSDGIIKPKIHGQIRY